MGSGCAVFDASGDGRLDLFFVNAGETMGKGAADRLYLRILGDEGSNQDAITHLDQVLA